MVGREVQRVEVVPLRLGLRSLRDLVAHGHEHVGEPVRRHRHRVARPGGHPVPRQRDVDGLFQKHPPVPFGFEGGRPVGEGLLQCGAGRAHPLAGLGAGLGRQRADLRVGQGQRRAVAEVRDARLLQLLQRPSSRDGGQRLVAYARDLGGRQRRHLDRVIVRIGSGHRILPWRGRADSAGLVVVSALYHAERDAAGVPARRSVVTGVTTGAPRGGSSRRSACRNGPGRTARRNVPAESPVRLSGWSARGHAKSELGSAAGRTADADRAAVRLDQALDDVEAQTGAAAPLAPPELPEHA